MKKISKYLFFIILFILIIIYIYIINKPYDYTINYKIKDFKIKESYNKEKGYYEFLISNNGNTYPYIIYNKYIKARKLIIKIDIYNFKDNNSCILPYSEYFKFYPVCYKKNKLISYNLNNQKIDEFKYSEEIVKTIQNKELKVNHFDSLKYLFYNYKGFYYVDKKIKEIKLFNKDIYSLDLYYQFNEYLIVPDYNNEHYFNKFYIINILNGKVNYIKADFNISFNSVFLFNNKNKVYLIDKKEEKEYVINIKKRVIKESEYVIKKDNRIIKSTYKDIIQSINNNQEKYILLDNKIYEKIKDYNKLISNKKVDKIVMQNKDDVYYLVKDKLYLYNNLDGEIFLAENFEWNFNNTNMIFVYR